MSSNMILFNVKLTVETTVNFGDPIGYEVVKVLNETLKELFTSSICFTLYQLWMYVYIYIYILPASFVIKYFIPLDKFVNV